MNRSHFSAALDTLLRDVRYAMRSFSRAPLAAATIVVTVGLGLGLVTVAFTILSASLFHVDDVRDPHELFAVVRQRSAVAEPRSFTQLDYEALLRDTSVFTDAFATTGDVGTFVEGLRREGRLVSGNFFSVLGVSAARGRALTAADDEPGAAPAMVLSHRAWTQYYASDPDIVGRTFRVNGTSFDIVGVTPEGFRGLNVIAAPDFWIPLSLLEPFRPLGNAEGSFGGLEIVGRLKPAVTPAQALAQLTVWDAQTANERDDERGATNLVLEPRLGTVPQPAEALAVFTPLFFAFGLILLIGCANVANLLLARLVVRQRELGIRLSIGASRRRVVGQLLTESMMLALLAAVVAFFVSRAVLTGVVYAIVTSFPPEIGNLRIAVPSADWRVALFLVGGAVLSTALFALTPALRATRVDLVRAIHGQVVRDARPGRTRNALVALQVTGSALLLICAAIFLRSAWSAAALDPGVRTADVVSVSVLNESQRPAILDAVRSEPTVAAIAAAWPSWLGGLGGVPAYAEGAGGRSVTAYELASPEFFDVLGIDIVRGRGFSNAERSPAEGVAVVAEATARELWPDADPLGQVLRIEPDMTLGRSETNATPAPSDDPLLQPRTAVVVGIARDVAGFRLGAIRLGGAGVYLPTDATQPGTGLITRVRSDAEVAQRAIVDRLATVDPNMGEVSTLKTLARAEAYVLELSFWLTLALGALALLLTLSGLFSVLSYLVEQRTAEIGVRMALGASSRSIGALVLRQSARPVGIGLVLGGVLTVGLAAVLRSTPAAEQIGAAVRLFDPVAYGAGALLIVAACAAAALLPALRAGSINPLAALRQD